MLQHGSYGPYMAVERDEVMTVLIFVGCAFLFEGVRRRVAWLLLFVGLAIGIAALMKPTAALLGLCLILPAFLALKKEQVATTQYVIWASAGAGIALALLLGFLLPGHALSAFLLHHAQTGSVLFVAHASYALGDGTAQSSECVSYLPASRVCTSAHSPHPIELGDAGPVARVPIRRVLLLHPAQGLLLSPNPVCVLRMAVDWH